MKRAICEFLRCLQRGQMLPWIFVCPMPSPCALHWGWMEQVSSCGTGECSVCTSHPPGCLRRRDKTLLSTSQKSFHFLSQIPLILHLRSCFKELSTYGTAFPLAKNAALYKKRAVVTLVFWGGKQSAGWMCSMKWWQLNTFFAGIISAAGILQLFLKFVLVCLGVGVNCFHNFCLKFPAFNSSGCLMMITN